MSNYSSVLLLGSNLGQRKTNIETALVFLQDAGCQILKKTEIKETQPVEFASNNIFCNIAVLINTNLSPVRLLQLVKNIEFQMGRLHDSKSRGQYEDRIIDIDIVFYNQLRYISKKLEIPHKKNAYDRDFSVALLYELAMMTN